MMTRSHTLPRLCVLAVLAAACNTLIPKHDDGKQAAEETAAPSVRIPAGSATWSRPGFTVYEDDGRLWVFEDGSEALTDFAAKGEPAKRVTLVGAGPGRRTLMGADRDTLESYALGMRFEQPGFVVRGGEGGRLWVFRPGSKDLADFVEKGEPAKRVTLVGAGPEGRTLLGSERETLEAYAAPWRYGRDGFQVFWDDGRLWVFRENSDSLVQYTSKGEPAKRVTLVGAGPDRRTLLGSERETLEAYAAPWRYGRPGFEVFWDDGRLWVFAAGSEALAEYRAKGEPAKRVTLVGAGPGGVTLMGADRETLERYMGEDASQ